MIGNAHLDPVWLWLRPSGVDEALAVRAEALAAEFPAEAPEDVAGRLDSAWKQILFNQFHDILAGTSVKRAYEHAMEELGLAKTLMRGIITDITRRNMLKEGPCANQRVVFANTGDRRFRGYVTVEPWIRQDRRALPVSFADRAGVRVESQKTVAALAFPGEAGYLLPVDLQAFEQRALEIRDGAAAETPPVVDAGVGRLSNERVTVEVGSCGVSSLAMKDGGSNMLGAGGVGVMVLKDFSDTWSHGLDRLGESVEGVFEAEQAWRVMETGPIRAGLANVFRFGDATLFWEVFVQGDEPVVRMRLRVNWNGGHRVVKLVVPVGFKPVRRIDGVPGGYLERPLNGQEFPVHNSIGLSGDGLALTVVSADCFSGDVQPDGAVRLTLLRSPVYAHHEPLELPGFHGYPFTDQGEHEYELALVVGREYDQVVVDDEVYRQTEPVVMSETTLGMPGFGES
jgi:alpha-mannosidase